MGVNEKISQLIKQEGLTKKALAEEFDIDPSYFNKMLKGERPWRIDYLEGIAARFKVALWELFRPEGEGGFKQPNVSILLMGVHHDKELPIDTELYLAVPLVEGPIAAGYTGAIPGEYLKGMVWVYRPEIGRRQHHNLRAVQLSPEAHSMEPIIRAGDIVIIDPDDREINPKAIYAVRLDSEGGCAIKRVRISEDYAVLLSDNQDYDPIILTKDRAENLIVGKVIWSWTSWVRNH